ncbi:unnamed protein product [Trifolium pratense]|uniref:Uncharacterized protein n=1 Tax=Trifolium pratense TaxID=57577 RepID=A0ACB0KUQ2_TRIPR|nr:unnamed protein product [Trifolium pratense]
MQRKKNMAKVFKVVYVTILFLSSFLVLIDAFRFCINKKDCPYMECDPPKNSTCIGNICGCTLG